jgi:hypothetical protein
VGIMDLISRISDLTTMDKVKVYIVLGFSILVAIAFLTALGMMIYSRITNPNADIASG